MNKLKLIKMLQDDEQKINYEFLKNIDSVVKVVKKEDINPFDDEGIKLIEATIPYIENIYKNPNKFIANEEEVVRIELAKRITSESIKDLAKNTSYIESIDENGDVKPSKILNINKEEVFDTYENRLIYTLVQHMKFYVYDKKKKFEEIINHAKETNDLAIQYAAVAKADGKKVVADFKTNTILNQVGIKNKKKDILDKFEDLETKILSLTSYEPYRVIDKQQITLITPPIKKTNLILKNVNFNYAIILWEYLQENLGVDKKIESTTETLKSNNLFKKLLDELFMLEYISLSRITEEVEEIEKKTKKKLIEDVLEYANLSERDMEKLFEGKTKLNDSMIEKQIRLIFSNSFEKYKQKIKWKR